MIRSGGKSNVRLKREKKAYIGGGRLAKRSRERGKGTKKGKWEIRDNGFEPLKKKKKNKDSRQPDHTPNKSKSFSVRVCTNGSD